jgi:hypothetical protein
MSEDATTATSGVIFHEIKAASREKVHRFRRLRILTFLLLAGAGLYGLSLIFQVLALAGGDPSQAAVPAALGVVAVLACYLLAGFWIYFAACNIRALGPRGMQVSPVMAICWYIVPFASLIMPFQGMEETYLASQSATGWKHLKTPLLLRVWWGAWLAAGITGYIVTFAGRATLDAETAHAFAVLALGQVVIDIVACGCFMAIVWRVHTAQSRSHRQAGPVAEIFS